MIPLSRERLQISPTHAEPAASSTESNPARWQEILAGARRTPGELAALLGLTPETISAAASGDFPLVVPQPYLERIRPGDPDDPLLLQVLPSAMEQADATGFCRDPLDERNAMPVDGIIRRFERRVLVTASPACGIHCRYCFRRHFPYREQVPDGARWERILHYIEGDDTIAEVVLSGGDPLVLTDRHLAWIMSRLTAIPHLTRIRIHTRMPVVIPQRIGADLLDIFARCRQERSLVIVIHCNHPRELDRDVLAALALLRRQEIPLLNQSVLLRRINDDAATLIRLSERLLDAGVMPYYLHLLDPVAGAAHFEVAAGEAAEMMREVARSLPGYLVPRLVRDTPGAPAKVLLNG